MSESALRQKVVTMLRKEFPETFFYKVADRYTSGIPDIVGCHKGQFFGIELKFGKNSLLRLQEHVLHKIRAAGGLAGVAYTLDDVRQILRKGGTDNANIN